MEKYNYIPKLDGIKAKAEVRSNGWWGRAHTSPGRPGRGTLDIHRDINGRIVEKRWYYLKLGNGIRTDLLLWGNTPRAPGRERP